MNENEPLCLLHGFEDLDDEYNYKHPRGIMLHLNDKSYWHNCIDCFSSYPKVIEGGKEELARQ